jgi:hypothetical protein
MAAAKMIEKPDFNVGSIEGTLRNLGDYLGQLLGIFLGDPDEAVRNMLKSQTSISAANKAWSYIENNSTGEKRTEYDINGNKISDVKQGVGAYFQGDKSQRGLSLGALDKEGNLRSSDAEGSISQADDLLMVYDNAEKGVSLDTERWAAGISREYDLALKKGKTAVKSNFVDKFLTPEEQLELEQSGHLKRTRYDYAIRDVDVQDDYDSTGKIGKEQAKILEEYSKKGMFGDYDNTVDVLTHLLGPVGGIRDLANLIYRGSNGTYNSDAEDKISLERLKSVGSGAWSVIKSIVKYGSPLWGPYNLITDAYDSLFGKGNKPGYGTEKRKVLIGETDRKSGDVILNTGEDVVELSPEVWKRIMGKFGYNGEISLNSRDYARASEDYLANVMRKENKQGYSHGELDETYIGEDGKRHTVHMDAETASIYKNKGYYIGSDAGFSKYVNEKRFRATREQGNSAFESNVFGYDEFKTTTTSGGTHTTAVHHGGIGEESTKKILGEFDDLIRNDDALREFSSYVNGFGGTSYKTDTPVFSGGNFNNELVAADETGKIIDLKQLFNNSKDKSSDELRKVYEELRGYNYNPNNIVVSQLMKSSNLQNWWTDLLTNLVAKGSQTYWGNSTFKASFEELVKDPEAYRDKLVDIVLGSIGDAPDPEYEKINPQEYKRLYDDWTKRRVKALDAVNHIKNVIAKFRTFIDNVDNRLATERKAKVLEQFSKLISTRVEAEGIKATDLKLVDKYTNDSYERTIAATDNNMLRISETTRGGVFRDNLDRYDNWTGENYERDKQFQEDVSNNTAASKVNDFVGTTAKGLLNNVMETFDDYTEETKSWFGGLFNNAKGVVNGFLRNLDYTKVSLTKWPENSLIQESDKLLIWHAFNGTKDHVVNFRVKGASGRFGAGRITLKKRTEDDIKAGVKSWNRHADTEGNRALGIAGKFDRIHSGQDIGHLEEDGKPRGAGMPIYAPFNGYITSVRTDIKSSGGKHVMIRQAAGDGKSVKGRYSMFVCHLATVTDTVVKAAGTETLIRKGSQLGTMGGTGNGGVDKKSGGYDPHFHINILDHEGGGPFDGPLEGDLPGIVSGYKGFLPGETTVYNAVDPLFVFCDDDANNITNRTLYLSSDKKVVHLDDANPKKIDRYKGGDLNITESGSSPNGDSEENPNNENGEGKDDRPFLEKAWDWLKDMAFKVKMEYLDPGLDSLKSSKEDFLKLKQGSTGMSFAKSSYSYSGQVTPEFVNYQNYLKNAGKIGLGADGQPLSEAEWRNQVFDMTGSDPVALKLGEYLNNGVAVKSASQLSNKDTKETISKYSETNNTENTINNVEGSTDNGEVNNVAVTNSMEEGDNNTIVGDVVKFVPNAEGFFGNKTLTDLQNEGKPFYNLEKKGDLTNERLVEIRKELVKNKEFMAKITDTLLAAFDRQAGLTVAGLGNNKKPNVTVANTVTGTGSSNVN